MVNTAIFISEFFGPLDVIIDLSLNFIVMRRRIITVICRSADIQHLLPLIKYSIPHIQMYISVSLQCHAHIIYETSRII